MNKLLSVLIGLSLLTAPGFAQDGKNAKGSKEIGRASCRERVSPRV